MLELVSCQVQERPAAHSAKQARRAGNVGGPRSIDKSISSSKLALWRSSAPKPESPIAQLSSPNPGQDAML